MADETTPPPEAAVAVPKPDESGQAADAGEESGTDDESRLSPSEVIFCDALARGETSCQAAKVAGVCERTARRWRQRPEIQAAVRSRVNDALASARAILAQGSALAAKELTSLVETASLDSARVAACRTVIEESAKLGELEDLAAKLADLEARLSRRRDAP
jgi:hypothetical protein